jgi:hypothetical protein
MATTPNRSSMRSTRRSASKRRSGRPTPRVLLGKFVPSAEAASVSKALHSKHAVPVTVRFSANSGMPKIADMLCPQ